MRPFDDLTTQGKARRLRPLASAALAQYDLDVARIELVRNDLNGIFRVRDGDGTSYLLRVCLPEHHELATLHAEVSWLQALALEPDIRAPQPIPATDGRFVVTAGAPGVPELRRCVLFSWLPGRELRRSATSEEFEHLGRLMARLHDHSDHWQAPSSFNTRTLDQLYPFGDPAGLLGPRHRDRFDDPTRSLIAGMERRIGEELDRLYRRGRPQVVHADLHLGNVKIYRGRLQPLDFEDLAWGFPIQDIAISLFYSLGNDRFPMLRQAFQLGYSETRHWPEEFTGQLDLLIVHRGIDLFNYLLTASFPGENAWFPAFIENIHGRYQELLDPAIE